MKKSHLKIHDPALQKQPVERAVRWYVEVATEHFFRDRQSGRGWQCGCGPCLTARRDGWRPELPR